MPTRDSMEFDVVIVGAGPAGLSAAIKLAQLNQAQQKNLSICVLEKGSEVGAHIISGAVLEPRALNELVPNWHELDAPVTTAVSSEQLLLLSATKAKRLPTPKLMQNKGNYIISLGKLCAWLAKIAEKQGVSIFPGFPAVDLIYDNNQVVGVKTGDMGVDRDGQPRPNFQSGIDLYTKQILVAEGCHGSLTKQLIKRFHLRDDHHPQSYGLGIKEIWQVDPKLHQLGSVTHTIGWPLDNKTYGGSFIYHQEDHQVAVGFVVGLDYQNPYLDPFQELQKFKTHPAIKPLFENGQRIAYGARALNEGGFQAIPKLTFPGGMLLGCSAGFLNVAKIKGIHNAMKSGMLAAESTFANLTAAKPAKEVTHYATQIKNSWVWQELKQVRNIRPAFHKGLWPGLIYSAIDTTIFRGKAPWTFKYTPDHLSLKTAKQCQTIDYPKADNTLTFDKASSVYLSNTNHIEDQPCHLQLQNAETAIKVNLNQYASPESRYCPAGVYEIVDKNGQPTLQINAQNCVHCKTCDIKDPTQNINWTCPEGSGGPNYNNL